MATFSRFSEIWEEVCKNYWIIQFPRRLEDGHSPLSEFKMSKLLNELMSARVQLKASKVYSVRAQDISKA